MDDTIEQERERIDSLLALSGMEFQQQDPELEAGDLGALAGWGFRTTEGDVQADVYLFDSLESVQYGQQCLDRDYPPGSSGLPLIGQNGGLLYVVRAASDEAISDAFDVASALGGEEEG